MTRAPSGLVALLALASCGPAAVSVTPAPKRVKAASVPFHRGGEYLTSRGDSTPVEQDGDVWRAVLGGVRVDVRGEKLVAVGSPGETLSGAVALPASSGVRNRYLGWDGRTLYRSPRWDAPLERVGVLSSDVQRGLPWFGDAVLLLTQGGAFLHRPDLQVAGAPGMPGAFAVAGVVAAARAGESSAAVLTALGRVKYTHDKGKTYRDVTAELPGAQTLETLGEAIRVGLSAGISRYLRDGKVSDDLGGYEPPSPPRAAAPIEGWDDRQQGSLHDALVRGGVLLEDGRALAIGNSRLSWVKLPARVVESHVLPEGLGTCTGLLTKEGPILACHQGERATIVDVGSSPRVEVTFPLDQEGPSDLGTFVGVPGETIGFIGACDGTRPVVDTQDDDRWDPTDNRSGQRTSSFCVRAGRARWLQHDAPSGDRADIHAWVPEATGDATVVVLRRTNTASATEPSYETFGPLHVLRVAGRRPPMRFASFGSNEALSTDARVLPGGDVDGLFPSEGGQPSVALGTLKKDGSFAPRALPASTEAVQLTGSLGVASTTDKRLFETLDAGATWQEIERPPLGPWARFDSCSPLGCRSSEVVRLGWGKPLDPSKRVTAEQARAAAQLEREAQQGRWNRFRTTRPIGMVACSFDGPATGARGADMWNAFGVPKHNSPQGQQQKVGLSGAMLVSVQWGPHGQRTLSGDAEFAWIELFDPAAPLHRASVPSSVFPPDGFRRWEIPLGYALAESGRVDPFAVSSHDPCNATSLDATGITRPIGGCAHDHASWSGTMGPVGIDVGSRMFTVAMGGGKLTVTRVDGSSGPPKSKGAPGRDKPEDKKKDEKKKDEKKAALVASGAAVAPPPGPPMYPGGPVALTGAPPPLVGLAPRPTGVSLRQLASTPIPYWNLGGLQVGVGARKGLPYVVVLDAAGAASVAPIDPETGRIGADEELAPLATLLAATSPKCAASPDDFRVIVSVQHHIGLEPGSLPGVIQPGTLGFAVLRWSKSRACLEAFDASVRDDRYEPDYMQVHEAANYLRKVFAKVDGKGGLSGALVVIGPGIEVRQKVTCR